MSLIKDFYRGLINPIENFGYSQDQVFLDLVADVQQLEDELISSLGEKEQKVYQEIKQSRVSLQEMEVARMFDYAFKMGAQFGVEIFNE